mgnify:FL=1|tara:strand:+ start:284 stop:811 length:528 start_codon:yes stop_codon:yes gene_type:complete
MKKIQIVLLFSLCIIPISISQVDATLYVDASISDMDKIKDSKYKASAVSIVRNAEGELMSVVRVEASRYLDDPIVDQFLKSDPNMLIKTGTLNNEKLSLYRTIAEYDNPQCLEKQFDVPGYNNECDWYHRAFVTMLGVTEDDTGEQFTIFRGLNHGFVVKPLYDVITIWDIITKN